MDSMDWTHKAVFDDILKEEIEPDKMLVIGLWDGDGAYNTRFWNVGMKVSEMIALIEVAKQRIIKMMEINEY